mgnify:CR=1 FL=1
MTAALARAAASEPEGDALRRRPRRRAITPLSEALLIAVLARGAALAFNALRPGARRLPLVAQQPYEILVSCPEQQGSAERLAATALHRQTAGTLFVDARDATARATWYVPGDLSLPYDYLEPPSAETVRRLLQAGARRIVVYGDGDNPDSGEQLARELNRRGLRRVFFVDGGAPALRRAAGGR